ncbi:hypothetical protein Tco_0276227 [Tanacetum coccineum]
MIPHGITLVSKAYYLELNEQKASPENDTRKGQHKVGELVDSNNGVFPVAYAIVEVESKSSWLWGWELSSMPCKHVVAVIFNMESHGKEVGIPEYLVAQCRPRKKRRMHKNEITEQALKKRGCTGPRDILVNGKKKKGNGLRKKGVSYEVLGSTSQPMGSQTTKVSRSTSQPVGSPTTVNSGGKRKKRASKIGKEAK